MRDFIALLLVSKRFVFVKKWITKKWKVIISSRFRLSLVLLKKKKTFPKKQTRSNTRLSAFFFFSVNILKISTCTPNVCGLSNGILTPNCKNIFTEYRYKPGLRDRGSGVFKRLELSVCIDHDIPKVLKKKQVRVVVPRSVSSPNILFLHRHHPPERNPANTQLSTHKAHGLRGQTVEPSIHLLKQHCHTDIKIIAG